METILAALVSESLGAQELVVETIATIGGLGGGEGSASSTDGSATLPRATAEAAGAVGAETRVASEVSESRATEPAVAEDQMVPPKASPGMVRPAVQAPSPQVVPPTTVEEDEVEEIKRDEPQTKTIQILQKRGDEVVILEEEDTTMELRRLETALAGVMKQIMVSAVPRVLVFVDGDRSSLLSLCICRGYPGLSSSGVSG